MKKAEGLAVAAIGTGAVVMGVGFAAAAFAPITGLVAGAYFAATAVPAIASTSAFFGIGATAASWVLGFGGAIGGLFTGRIARKVMRPLAFIAAPVACTAVAAAGLIVLAPLHLLPKKKNNLLEEPKTPSMKVESNTVVLKNIKDTFQSTVNKKKFSINSSPLPKKRKKFVL